MSSKGKKQTRQKKVRTNSSRSMEDMSDYKREIETRQRNTGHEIKEMEHLLEIYRETSDAQREHITTFFRCLKSELGHIENEFMEEVNSKYSENFIKINELIEEKRDLVRKYEQFLEDLDVKNENSGNSNSLRKEIRKQYQQLPESKQFESRLPVLMEFKPGNIKIDSRKGDFGRFVEKVAPVRKMQKRNTFTTNAPSYRGKILKKFPMNFHATTIVPVNGENVWMSCYYDESIRVINDRGENISTVDIDFHIYDFFRMRTGHIIASDTKDKAIKEISSDGSVRTLMSTSPLAPLGICLNSSKQIVCGLQGPPHKICLFSFVDGKGAKVREIESAHDGSSLFCRYVDRVKQNGNGDYIVLDGCKMIVVLDSNWTLKWSYTGQPTDNRKSATVYITGICCDSANNIIFADSYNYTVGILDQTGKFLATVLSASDGLERPRAISVDEKNKLWLSCKSGREIICVKYM